MLPRVKIYYENGALGSTSPMDDGVVGLVASATAVSVDCITTFELNKAYLVTKLADLMALGVNGESTGANANLYKCVKEFYDEAPIGSKLWIMGVADTLTVTDILDKNEDYAKKLIESARGAINVLIVKKTDDSDYEADVVDGLDSDVITAMSMAQQLAEWATDNKFAPFFTILEGRHYGGTASELPDLSEYENNRVAILIGDTVASSTGAAVGLLAGRIAAIPVQRSIARVKTGAVVADALYIGAVLAEDGNPDVIHDNGYICPRTFVGKAGYYWSDDKLATATTDDYALIPRRRVIDKAYRIAYDCLIDELSDEIPVTDDGKIPASIVKNIQQKVETAIGNNMTAFGNLGNDPGDQNDMGVACYIDPDQNIVSSSRLVISLRVKPHGYAKYIDVYLGFKTVNA